MVMAYPEGILEISAADNFRAAIRTVVGFPIPDFPFADIGPALALPNFLSTVTSSFGACLSGIEFDYVVGIATRGLFFAAPLAAQLGKGLVVARKKGELPGEVVSQAFENEYGAGELAISAAVLPRGVRCIVVDDFLATGGTAEACIACIHALGAEVAAQLFLIEDPSLGGRARLTNRPTFSALIY
jgi:adenine phosphoribosyltransferase